MWGESKASEWRVLGSVWQTPRLQKAWNQNGTLRNIHGKRFLRSKITLPNAKNHIYIFKNHVSLYWCDSKRVLSVGRTNTLEYSGLTSRWHFWIPWLVPLMPHALIVHLAPFAWWVNKDLFIGNVQVEWIIILMNCFGPKSWYRKV